MAVKEVSYYSDPLQRLDWHPHKCKYRWYIVTTKSGQLIADLFKGKSGKWFAVIYNRTTLRGNDASLKNIELHILGSVINPHT